MSEAKRVASPPEAFTPEEAVYELGRMNGSGEPLYVRVRAVPRSKVAAFFNGIPTQSGAPQSEVDAASAKHEAIWRDMMRAGVIEPRLKFAPEEPGDLLWDDLDLPLQLAIQNAMLEQSGIAIPGEAGSIARFRVVERGGIPVRGGADGPVSAGADAR